MPDQRCKRLFAAVSEFLDGELAQARCRELERHLKNCKPCEEFLQTLKTTTEACRKYGAAHLTAIPPDVESALRSGVVQAALRKKTSSDPRKA